MKAYKIWNGEKNYIHRSVGESLRGKTEMTDKEAAQTFLSLMESRESWQKVCAAAYEYREEI